VDLTDAKATQAMLDQVVAAHAGIDVLINIAGGFTWETLENGSLDSWARMQAMNVMTAATITKLALPELKKSAQGRIINMGAGGAVKADMGMGAYAASKAGVHKLTEALAVELMGTSVTVNAVLPSIIDTPTNRKDMPTAKHDTWVKPSAIAELIVAQCALSETVNSGALVPVYGKA